MCIVSLAASAQERTVQNRPYTDLRPFHFGVVVGTHVQDMEVRMAGPMTITTEDGTQETLVTADQSRWTPASMSECLASYVCPHISSCAWHR